MKGKGIMNKNEKNLTHRICSRMVICMAILAAIRGLKVDPGS